MRKATDIMSKTGKWLLVFGFIFSQLSFPLEVLADEVITTEKKEQDVMLVTDEPVIKINDVETTEYTIGGIEDTNVTVVLEYQGQSEKATFDFSKKLYGIYQYTFTTVEKTVTINYLGNNADLLKPYENVVDLTKKITCNTDECIIGGFGVDLLTVADITTGYYNLAAFEDYYGATVEVVNGEEVLLNTDTVFNGYELRIVDNQNDTRLVNTTPKSLYTINRVGDADIPADGLIDIKDQDAILDDILQENEITSMNDVNEDGILNILDATHSTFIDNTLNEEVTDVLTNTLTSDNDEILVGEEVEVKLFVSGFDMASLYGIEGILSYDDEVLELDGASLYETNDEDVKNLGYLNLKNNRFAYVLSDGFNNIDVALLTLKFKALAVGTSEITISNIIESYGETFEVENDSVTTVINVLEYGKGGDVEEDNDNSISVTPEESTVIQVQNIVRPVVLSSDYYIKNLVIKGYEIDFDKYIYEYSIKVGHDVTSLELDVLLNDNNSIYYIEGNENFKVGENFVYIVVKAENGSTKTYTIKVERDKETVKKATEVDEDEVVEEEKSSSKTVIIILIILVIIGLIYVIFKDDEEDAKEIKKDNHLKKEKVKVEKNNTKEVKKTTKKDKK